MSSFANPRVLAIVRELPGSFARAICTTVPAEPIDLARARTQHAAYVAALEQVGARIVWVAGDDALPDCCFVEDTAVVARGIALVTRPGASSRRAETAAVARVLARRMPIEQMLAPATLDGGDCCLLGSRLYVGRSTRSNRAGCARARDVFSRVGIEVTEVPVRSALHLKSVCSPLGAGAVLVARGAIDPRTFAGVRVIEVPDDEARAANAVVIGQHAIVANDCPKSEAAVRAAGFEPHPVDTSELRKADGALTCLSIVVCA